MSGINYPSAPREPIVEEIHGEKVEDPYRWLEKANTEAVKNWDAAQSQLLQGHLKDLEERPFLRQKLESLWRYDDESTPTPCQLSARIFYQTKQAAADKWVLCVKENAEAEGRILLDPNTWGRTETLDFWTPSPDGKYLAFGRANAGDEAAITYILDVETGELLDDTLRGWRQGFVSWLHDNSGFYYSSKPLESEAIGGEHHYYHRVWFHKLGTQAADDTVALCDDAVKEHYHWSTISDDGKTALLFRCHFDRMQVFIQPVGNQTPAQDISGGPDHNYFAVLISNKLVIVTDENAPLRRVMIADRDAPEKAHWRELIPEHAEDTLASVTPIGGRLYLTYQHRAATRIEIHDLDGQHIKSLELPGIGTAKVWGMWQKPEVWLSYVSYNHINSVYTWDFESEALSLYRKTPIDLDMSDMEVHQVWYPSKDGTQISMYLFHRKGVQLNGKNPVFLTGYGGFNLSRSPMFSTPYALWAQAGGVVAVCNLRGGGEYGKAWHEAGMRDKKQNVFDDFIGAAEWLIAKNYTAPQHLCIVGGSNGGLLVGACTVQRPELYGAVLCQVPLLDMVRYHKFGLANIWSLEYGSADDPEMAAYLHAYSPYHNVQVGKGYPAMMITGSENDARTDPLHARKFGAAVQHAADENSGPILVAIQRDSGHLGAVTIEERAQQWADNLSFLGQHTGLKFKI